VFKLLPLALVFALPVLALAQPPPLPWDGPAQPVLPATEPSPTPNLRISVMAGGLASLSADASGVSPFARIKTEARLTKTERGPSMHVTLDLTALPGDSVTLEDPQTYKAIEASVGASQPLGGPLLFSAYAEMGFASRLPRDPQPRDRSAKWVAAGFLFQTHDREHRLTLTVARDQRLADRWVTAVQVAGQVKLRESKGLAVYLVGSASLSVEAPMAATTAGAGHHLDPPRDSIRAGIAIGF